MYLRPKVLCPSCNSACSKLISGDVQFAGVSGRNDMYNFTDTNTTGKPIAINGRRQWREHLKARGLTDDIPQGVPDASRLLKPRQENKESKRREYKEAIGSVLKEKGILQKYGK